MQLHIGYLRSLEDSKRARSACVKFLQNWMASFYPERLDIFRQAEEMARDLGGQLEVPGLSWKYSWIRAIFGLRLARRAELFLQNLKWSLVRYFDRALFRLEGRGNAGLN